MERRQAFTLIELLVVIAIIGILAGITFPVFARAKDGAYRSSDITNMNQLRAAIQLYKADQGAYPPALLGYATLYQSGPQAGNVVPADQLRSALFPKLVPSVDTFRPAYNRGSGNFNSLLTTAQWPNRWVDPTETDANRLQRFDPTVTVQRDVRDGLGGCTVVNNEYYRVSGYDVAEVRTPTGNRTELRYAPFWSGYAVAVDPCGNATLGSENDNPRQLGYSDPPDTTVVTWNSFYRDYTNGVPQRTKRDIVLFLGGSARPFDSAQIAERSWLVVP
ncbi:MAG: type II secretion system protein [Fimbriimonadaceae bacterium]|nr:type II secretion system protein [Fimbriimonadaceae bacterium]